MKRVVALLTTAAVVMSLASAVSAANWTKVGTTGLKYTGLKANQNNQGWIKDRRRIKLASIAVDPNGNVFCAYPISVGGNPAAGSGVTIFKANGGRIDINLPAQGLPGGITRLVVGGDGLVYGLQNWIEINWNYAGSSPHRILQFNANGNVVPIWCPDNDNNGVCDTGDNNRIVGMTVGGDGNIYWIMVGVEPWRRRFLWRYDVALGQVEQSPQNGTINNGWSESQFRMLSFEYVGKGQDGQDYFAILWNRNNGTDWDLCSIRWPENVSGDAVQWPNNYRDGIRRIAANARLNSGWGRDWETGIAYDPVRNRLYAVARGNGGGSPPSFPVGGTNFITRWNGATGGTGLFQYFDGGLDRTIGVQNCEIWHANRNDPTGSGVSNFVGTLGQMWVQAMAVNPADGRLWTSHGADPSYAQGDLGHVVIHGDWNPNGEYWDAGVPERNAWVMALAFHGGKCYALTINFETEEWSLYSTADLEPQSPGGALGDIKSRVNGLDVITSNAVVTFPYPNDNSLPYFYIQDENRTAGFKVTPSDPGIFVPVGQRVQVAGKTLVVDGEATIHKATVVSGTAGAAPVPLYVRNADLGGASVGVQPPVAPGKGLTNMGLLVRISGKLTESGADATGFFFRVDDGSGVKIGSQTVPGIKVRGFPPTGVPGEYIGVVGVLGAEWDGQRYVPVIRTRDFSDVQQLAAP